MPARARRNSKGKSEKQKFNINPDDKEPDEQYLKDTQRYGKANER
jgi:hypothetical protein